MVSWRALSKPRRYLVILVVCIFATVVAGLVVYCSFSPAKHRITKEQVLRENARRMQDLETLLLQDAMKWRQARQVGPDSGEITNLIISLVQREGPTLSEGQRTQLVRAVTSWLHATATGRYADYLAFRQPDYIRFEKDSMDYFTYVLERGAKGKVADLGQLSDEEKCALMFRTCNTATAASVPVDSLNLRIAVGEEELADGSRLRYINTNYIGIIGIFQGSSPFHYQITEEQVLKQQGAIDLAMFHVRLITREGQYILPLHLTFFWSATESRWKPFEYMGSTRSPMVKGGPDLYFFF